MTIKIENAIKVEKSNASSALLASFTSFAVVAGVLSTAPVSLGASAAIAGLACLGFSSVACFGSHEKTAEYDVAYAGVLGTLFALAKTMVFTSFALSGIAAVVSALALFCLLVCLEVIAGLAIGASVSKIAGSTMLAIGSAQNLSARLFGSLGRIA